MTGPSNTQERIKEAPHSESSKKEGATNSHGLWKGDHNPAAFNRKKTQADLGGSISQVTDSSRMGVKKGEISSSWKFIQVTGEI